MDLHENILGVNHRITVKFRLEETSGGHLVQTLLRARPVKMRLLGLLSS